MKDTPPAPLERGALGLLIKRLGLWLVSFSVKNIIFSPLEGTCPPAGGDAAVAEPSRSKGKGVTAW